MIRLRFAPSPTGKLHLGGLRTALFCWLFARKNNGSFIFRLEDTDQRRIIPDVEKNLIKMLDWAGIDADESPLIGGKFGPYRQSERLHIYKKYAEKLIVQDQAYRCFCSEERLKNLRDEQRLKGETPRYDRFCRNLNKEESFFKANSGENHVIRMKIPEKPEILVLHDLVRGKVSIDTSSSEDQVLVKSDGYPTYHLAAVVDDHLMKISHVVRGEEWLSSFPKHLLLYRYFDWKPPKFAHLPLILNPDRSKLSKRQSDIGVEDFYNQGYLPETLVNFVALLGWSPTGKREIFSLSELVNQFSFKRINKSGAVFDREKLNWMNQKYIQNLTHEDLIRKLNLFYKKASFNELEAGFLNKILEIQQPRLTTLNDFFENLNFFVDDNPEIRNPEVLILLRKDSSKKVLNEFLNQIMTLESLTKENLGNVLKNVESVTNIKGQNLWLPLRYAITLEVKGPDLKLIVDLFGKGKCSRLVKRALEV